MDKAVYVSWNNEKFALGFKLFFLAAYVVLDIMAIRYRDGSHNALETSFWVLMYLSAVYLPFALGSNSFSLEGEQLHVQNNYRIFRRKRLTIDLNDCSLVIFTHRFVARGVHSITFLVGDQKYSREHSMGYYRLGKLSENLCKFEIPIQFNIQGDPSKTYRVFKKDVLEMYKRYEDYKNSNRLD